MCLHNFGKADVTLLHGEDAVDVILEKGDVVLVFADTQAAQDFAENPTAKAPWATSGLTEARLFVVAGYAGSTPGYAVWDGEPEQFPLKAYVIVRHGENATIRRKPEQVTAEMRVAIGLAPPTPVVEEDDLWA